MPAGMVDQYIAAHAGTQNLFDIGKSDSTVQVESPTVFFQVQLLVNVFFESSYFSGFDSSLVDSVCDPDLATPDQIPRRAGRRSNK